MLLCNYTVCRLGKGGGEEYSLGNVMRCLYAVFLSDTATEWYMLNTPFLYSTL